MIILIANNHDYYYDFHKTYYFVGWHVLTKFQLKGKLSPRAFLVALLTYHCPFETVKTLK